MNFMPFKGPWLDVAVLIMALILITRMVASGQFGVLEGLAALLMAVLWAIFRFFKQSTPWRMVGWLVLALWVVAIIGAWSK